MYTIQQLQAADYLLKKILNDNISPFKEKDLKIVIELNGVYWYGDFVNFKDGYPIQYFIEGDGDVNYTRFSWNDSNATKLFKKTMDTYHRETRARAFHINPFKRISTLDLMFHTIFKLIDLSDIEPDDSPINPYLLNAHSLDRKQHLPFINLENQQIKVVSLIETTNVTD